MALTSNEWYQQWNSKFSVCRQVWKKRLYYVPNKRKLTYVAIKVGDSEVSEKVGEACVWYFL